MKNNMITIQYLKDWSEENSEDVVFDGPFAYTMDHLNTLSKNLSDALVKEFGIESKINDIDDMFNWVTDGNPIPLGMDKDKAYDILLQCFADLINKNNIKELY